MGVAIAIGLFSGLGSVAMVPTHIWDAVPGDVVSSVVLAAAAATAAGVSINEYDSEVPGSDKGPMIIHAGKNVDNDDAVKLGAARILNEPHGGGRGKVNGGVRKPARNGRVVSLGLPGNTTGGGQGLVATKPTYTTITVTAS